MDTSIDAITAARAAALFVSDVSAAERPSRAAAERAVLRAIRAHGGSRGCVADVAAYYGDYPELAAARMAWARAVAEGLRRHARAPRMVRLPSRRELLLAA